VRWGDVERDGRADAGQVLLELVEEGMAAEGWWSGDSHVHFLSTPGAQLEQIRRQRAPREYHA